MTQERTKEIVEELKRHRKIYAYAYGRPWQEIYNMYGNSFYRRDTLIEIWVSKLHLGEECFQYVWGWPGPDSNFYYYEDFGITWGFTEDDIRPMTEKAWKQYEKQHKGRQIR